MTIYLAATFEIKVETYFASVNATTNQRMKGNGKQLLEIPSSEVDTLSVFCMSRKQWRCSSEEDAALFLLNLTQWRHKWR